MSHLNINGVDKPLDHVYVKARTENLFDISTTEDTEYYINYAGDRLSGSNGDRFIAQKIRVAPLTEYTFSWGDTILGTDGYPPYIRISQYENTQFLKRYLHKCTDYVNKTFKITTDQSATVLDIRYDSSTSLRGQTITNLMLNTGSTALPYEPYLITKEAWEARTRVILHNLTNPLCGIRTYKDTLDLSTGVLTRYIKKLVLTGKENWTSETGDACYALSISPNLIDRNDLLSTHFFVGNYSGALAMGQLRGAGTPSAKIVFNYDNGTIGIEGFKAYLSAQYAAGTPVTVWYVLATPETETITVPSNLTGIVEGYLTQSSTPSPTYPVYPIANGTLEQGGTYSLDTGAYAIAWGRTDTFTGTNSISARCYGLPIKSWEIDGNTQQDGTPAPDEPIIPEFVGERTENLFDKSNADIYGNSTIAPLNQWDYSPDYTGRILRIKCKSSTQYTISFNQTFDNATIYRISTTGSDSVPISGETGTIFCTSGYSGDKPITKTITTGDSAKYILLQINGVLMDSMCDALMINEGSSPLPYEPYGYKIPITCGGQTQNVYLGQVQTTRKIKKVVFDGTQSVYSCVRTTDSQNYCCMFRFSDIGMTDIKDYNISMASIDYPIFLSDRFVNKGNLKRTYYQNISAGEMGANNLDGMNRYIIFCVSGLTTAEEYIDWFTNNPTTLYYILATPTTSIVNEPLAKIGTYADKLITVPVITPQTGTNTLTVDTTLSPSSVSITGHIKETV